MPVDGLVAKCTEEHFRGFCQKDQALNALRMRILFKADHELAAETAPALFRCNGEGAQQSLVPEALQRNDALKRGFTLEYPQGQTWIGG